MAKGAGATRTIGARTGRAFNRQRAVTGSAGRFTARLGRAKAVAANQRRALRNRPRA